MAHKLNDKAANRKALTDLSGLESALPRVKINNSWGSPNESSSTDLDKLRTHLLVAQEAFKVAGRAIRAIENATRSIT